MMMISIVIPTFNRATLLRRTLPAILNQVTEPWFDYEVLLISNGSADDTEQVARSAGSDAPGRLRYFRIDPTGGPSAPRNYGIHRAAGQVLIIQDDDVLPDPEMVLAHARFHREHPDEVRAALGEVYVADDLLQDPMSLFHSFPYDETRHLPQLSYLHFWTCNVSLKRDFMLSAGMFNEQFLFYEDVICAHGLQKKGMILCFVPEARGQHLHEMGAQQIAPKGQFYGRWLFEFFQKYPYPEVMRRFEIVSRACGWKLYISSLLRRGRFRMLDNSMTSLILRALGATNGRRSRLSDMYYNYELRRNILAGYRERKLAFGSKSAKAHSLR